MRVVLKPERKAKTEITSRNGTCEIGDHLASEGRIQAVRPLGWSMRALQHVLHTFLISSALQR